jgi:hypothetical protein
LFVVTTENTLGVMGVRVAFEGGPADGTVEECVGIETALPSLFWSREEPERIAAVYRRAGDGPDPVTGAWRYDLVGI